MDLSKYMSARFNPTLSWDGVAIIGSCVCALLWFGTLKATIEQHSQTLKHHEELLQSLSEGQKLISQNIAVLQTLVNERTGNTFPKSKTQ
jgi:hypothetical protein